jgi:2-amino-4-hydroxy-6-hydroxymethyldihydropteridine diphosphokinase
MPGTVAEPALISLGSNIEPLHYLPEAVRALRRLGDSMRVSKAYQNPAVGPQAQPDFINAAVSLQTDLDPPALRRELRRIERQLGRVRTQDKYAPRTIDLDLCLLGDRVIEDDDFKLPDPEVQRRPHLAIPLAEVAPDMIYPLTGETLSAVAGRLRPLARLQLRADLDLARVAADAQAETG